jgi:hypothetical protein
LSEDLPASGGQPAIKQSAVNRVVDGQVYDYFTAADGLAWYHDTGRTRCRAWLAQTPASWS